MNNDANPFARAFQKLGLQQKRTGLKILQDIREECKDGGREHEFGKSVRTGRRPSTSDHAAQCHASKSRNTVDGTLPPQALDGCVHRCTVRPQACQCGSLEPCQDHVVATSRFQIVPLVPGPALPNKNCSSYFSSNHALRHLLMRCLDQLQKQMSTFWMPVTLPEVLFNCKQGHNCRDCIDHSLLDGTVFFHIDHLYATPKNKKTSNERRLLTTSYIDKISTTRASKQWTRLAPLTHTPPPSTLFHRMFPLFVRRHKAQCVASFSHGTDLSIVHSRP